MINLSRKKKLVMARFKKTKNYNYVGMLNSLLKI